MQPLPQHPTYARGSKLVPHIEDAVSHTFNRSVAALFVPIGELSQNLGMYAICHLFDFSHGLKGF